MNVFSYFNVISLEIGHCMVLLKKKLSNFHFIKGYLEFSFRNLLLIYNLWKHFLHCKIFVIKYVMLLKNGHQFCSIFSYNNKQLHYVPQTKFGNILFLLRFLLLWLFFFFLLSSPNFFVRECSHKTTQYMKLKPF